MERMIIRTAKLVKNNKSNNNDLKDEQNDRFKKKNTST